jgi:hypothetical protein
MVITQRKEERVLHILIETIVLRDVQCPRCNGYGRPRIIALARYPSI